MIFLSQIQSIEEYRFATNVPNTLNVLLLIYLVLQNSHYKDKSTNSML